MAMKLAVLALACVPFSAAQFGGLAALQGDVNELSKALVAANNSLVPFTGGSLAGIVGLAKVNEGVAQVSEAIQKMSDDAKATSPPLNFDDSVAVGLQFLGVQPQINQLVDTLISKRSEFDKAGFKVLDVTSLIRDVLTTQKADAGALGTVFIAALDPGVAGIAGPVVAEIDAKFASAVDAFQGRGGKIRIPPSKVPQLTDLLTKLARTLGIRARMASIDDTVVQALDVSDKDLAKLSEWENDWSGVSKSAKLALNGFGIV